MFFGYSSHFVQGLLLVETAGAFFETCSGTSWGVGSLRFPGAEALLMCTPGWPRGFGR